jgi:P-type Cu2+ transporter
MGTVDTVLDMKSEQNDFHEAFGTGNSCFHCDEPVPEELSLFVLIDKVERPMCCPGCQAVANAIIDYGLTDYYKFRTESAIKPEELVPEQLRDLSAYDDHLFQEELVTTETGNLKSTSLLLADMTCPACVWLIESRLSRLEGVVTINVNYSTQRAYVQWNDSNCHLSNILKSIATLGYKARPYDISQGQKQLDEEQRNQLRRLGLAGVLGMQVMMISIALYVGDWSGMEDRFRVFLSWIGLLLCTPVVFYSAQTFFVRAWRDLRLFRTGMDVPVSLGISIAYVNSIWATSTGSGQIYYDSIVMFVFFLLTGRYFEFRARRQSALYVDTIGQLIPNIATRMLKNNETQEQEMVSVASLKVDDILLIRPGDVIPVDGYLVEGETTVDEALLTGESAAVLKSKGDMLIGGSTNVDQSVQMSVSRVGKDTLCSHIYNLMEQGQRARPEIVALSNRISAWFVFSVLVISLLTAVYWISHNPSMWVSITISVLVVSCPCALSLATPVALAAAATRLMKEGVILVNTNAIEALNKVTTFVFDKTGTLTSGRLVISKIIPVSSKTEDECLAIARAIEINSSHPLAKAFAEKTCSSPKMCAVQIKNYPAAGISAEVEDVQYFLGNEKFIEQHTALTAKADIPKIDEATHSTIVIFADKSEIHCFFILEDSVRDGAQELLDFLKAKNKTVTILSGDSLQATTRLAEHLNLANVFAGQSPDQKMMHIQKIQKEGEIVAMVGDGVNDAPVLASANVSISMGDGTALASANADLILLNSRLDKLIGVIKLARAGKNVIRQNMGWAISYNLVALPLAVTGMISPWMAAIGMSLSSLIVVINSGRLNRDGN